MLFKECPSCSAKPGSPILCESCLHNRTVIGHLEKMLNTRYMEDKETGVRMHFVDSFPRKDKSQMPSRMLRVLVKTPPEIGVDLDDSTVRAVVREYFERIRQGDWVKKKKSVEHHTSHSFWVDEPDPNEDEKKVIFAVEDAERLLKRNGLL